MTAPTAAPAVHVLLNKEAAAAALATSPRRIDELRKCGKLEALLDGIQWKFAPEHLREYAKTLTSSLDV